MIYNNDICHWKYQDAIDFGFEYCAIIPDELVPIDRENWDSVIATPKECEERKRKEFTVIDDYQKIYPEWINDRLPASTDGNFVLRFRNGVKRWVEGKYVSGNDHWIERPASEILEPYRNTGKLWSEWVATPHECFCKKNGMHSDLKEFAKDVVKQVEAGGGSIGVSNVEVKGDGGILVPEVEGEKIISINVWMQGDSRYSTEYLILTNKGNTYIYKHRGCPAGSFNNMDKVEFEFENPIR